MGALDAANFERTSKIDAAKTAEAISIVGAAEVQRRGGVNAQGYFNDVPAYQQLTASERASVLIDNGNRVNTDKMLDISTDMDIIKERLQNGKGGPKTQKIQKEVIRKLDEQITEAEDQIANSAATSKLKGTEVKLPASEATPEGMSGTPSLPTELSDSWIEHSRIELVLSYIHEAVDLFHQESPH